MIALYVDNNPDTQIFTGRSVGLGGSHKINEISNEAYYDGDVSAIIIQNLPFWAEFIRVPNRSIALMDEWEEKIEKMARATMQHDVTTLSGVPSWMLLLLRRILEITNKKNIKEVWPNLEVYFHGGVNFDPYRQQFKDITSGSGINYMETYNASEGFFGIQDQPDSRELLLMLDYGVFYEFMPASQVDNKNARTYQLHEVETGVNYAMIISTNSGLWRYMIGDTVEFTSLNPFRIKISGRTKNFINAVGEELIVDNAEKAMLTATRKCQAVVNEYTAAPVYFGNNSNAAHQWFIEFKQAPENLDYFIDTFDNALKSLNSDYEAKRYQNMILRRPIVESLPEGSFYKWLKSKGKLGGQYKVPRLSNDRKLATELTDIIKNT